MDWRIQTLAVIVSTALLVVIELPLSVYGNAYAAHPRPGHKAQRRHRAGHEKTFKKKKHIVLRIKPSRVCKATKAFQTHQRLMQATKPRISTTRGPQQRLTVDMGLNKDNFLLGGLVTYKLRSSGPAYASVLWFRPDGTVHILFRNLPITSSRWHVLKTGTRLSRPLGLERWFVIATLRPHTLPCKTNDAHLLSAVEAIMNKSEWALNHRFAYSRARRMRSMEL
jgi:hypothetical protein